MKKRYFFLLFVLAAAHHILAQVQPRLVQSFNMYPGQYAGKSGVALNGLFATDSFGTLMVSDGTPAGTRSVYSMYYISAMLVVNNKLFMIADDSAGGRNQLWVSDGTTTGTHMVKDIGHATDTSGVLYFGFTDYSLIAYNNHVYFFGNDDIHGVELWKSDGTDTGTVMVKDINPAPGASMLALYNFPFGQFRVAGDKLFFSADDGLHGPELWCTDGTAANTHIVKDLWPGAMGANPQYLTAFNDKLCFWAASVADTGLYITDGTDTGTKLLVRGIMTPNSEQAVLNNKLYFFADSLYTLYSSALWVTDGTAAGTKWVSHAFYSDVQYSYQSYLGSFLTAYNSKLYFGAADNLWVSDGINAAGTYRLKTLADEPGLCCTPTQVTLFDGKMYMRAADFDGRVELCISDGTDTGTKIVDYSLADYSTGNNIITTNYLRMPLTVVGTKLFFWNTYETDLGHSLYVIDPLAESVEMLHSNTGLTIFPNPVTNDLYLEASADNVITRVDLLSITGQLLISQPVSRQSNAQLSLAKISNGTFIVKAYTQKGIITRQLVREN